MRSITRKKILSALIIGVMAILLMPVLVSAATIKTDLWGGVQPPSNVGVGSDPRTIIQSVIGFLMGFLGIIAVLIILIAGFQWMTAGGDDAKVKKSQTMMIQGVIGLVIILAAWLIASFAITNIQGLLQGNSSSSVIPAQ